MASTPSVQVQPVSGNECHGAAGWHPPTAVVAVSLDNNLIIIIIGSIE